MQTSMRSWVGRFLVLTAILTGFTGLAVADGSETLGVPSIPIASGSGYVAKGVGLALVQPGTINITIPPGATIRQVLLYWEGQHTTASGDNTIIAAGNPVTGTLIGGPNFFFAPGVQSSSYRADVTALNLVAPGPNAVSVQGLSFNRVNNGAGLIVIYDDGAVHSDIQLRDGNDLAYRLFPEPRASTVPQTFLFDPAPAARQAALNLFFSSVQGVSSTGGPQRPNRIAVTIGAVTTNYDDVLRSYDGEEWDTWTQVVTIPAGVDRLTVQAISGPGGDDDPTTPAPRPASLCWLAAGLSVPCTGTIGNFVWRDANCDGIQGTGETGIPGVTVRLYDSSNNLLDTTVTDAAGYYLFTGLCAGGYSVEVDASTLPPGLTPTTCSNAAGVANNSNCSPSPVTLLTDAGEDLTIDFGYCAPQGGEGCTPGYWKQPHHFDSWPAPYLPGTPFSSVFENAFPGKTLLQVVSTGGGGLIALGRHTVAALLNAASSGVDYDMTPADVISAFNAVYPGPDTSYERLKNIFEDYNEQGCPLNRGIAPAESEPTTHRLLQNYPNPFNPTTEIVFQLVEATQVRVRVFNVLGEEVRSMAEGVYEAGTHVVTWDATDNSGRAVTSGVYFCEMQTGKNTRIIKMSLMR